MLNGLVFKFLVFFLFLCNMDRYLQLQTSMCALIKFVIAKDLSELSIV